MTENTLCACGSGLAGLRCCQAPEAALVAPAAGWRLDPLLAEAEAALGKNDRTRALALARDVLDLAPGRIDALWLLARLLRLEGPASAAEAVLRRIIARNPNHVGATHDLTLLLFGRGALAEAEQQARNAVRIAPQHPQSHNLLGMVLTEANHAWIGEYHYRRALELRGGEDAILLANLAWNLKNQGRMAEARGFYEKATRLGPDEVKTLLGWAMLEEADRDFPRAAELLDRAAALQPDHEGVRLARATLAAREGHPRAALALIATIAATREDKKLSPIALSQQGRLLDQLDEYDAAFAAFSAGKARAHELGAPAYLAGPARDLAQRLERFFTAERLAALPRPPPAAGPRPIFILGFPRSGTTLIEQILSGHPDITAGDELPFINELTETLPRLLGSPLAYPEALAELWMGDQRDGLMVLRDTYLRRVRNAGVLHGREPRWFTDKMPLNEMHLGLIALLFPDAPLIHLIRHPLDVTLSVFSNHLTHGFYCAAALDSIAEHYRLVMQLVRHYRGAMTLRYLPIRYEDVVSAPERGVRRLLDFIGVPFDPACLAFHENRRAARTASYAQVTEKLYDRSRYRHRPYLAQLAPVLPILSPVIAALGYALPEDAPPPAAPAAPPPAPAGATLAPEALQRMLAEASGHEQAGRFGPAEEILARVLAAEPDHPHANHLQGIVAYRLGRIAEARARMERSIALAPEVALYPRNLCEVYRAAGLYDEALATGRRAVELAPEDPLALTNLGIIHASRLELDAALATADRALALNPEQANAHFLRAETLLLTGDFAAGWEEYEWRHKLASTPRLLPETERPHWDGRPLPEGTLLLIADQGFGDVIQFARYIPWAAERARDIVVASSAEMRPILAQFPAVRRIFDRWEECGDFAAYCPLSGLPRLATTRLESIPAPIPYLRADPALAATWRTRLADLLPPGYRRVGLAWAGRASHNNDRYRSTRLARLGALGEIPGIALVSLQKGEAAAEVGAYLGAAPLLSLGPELKNFADTMAVLENLDLLITVDTAVGHLAGAMGRPAWLMLAYAPDWRWQLGRAETPWYPGMRLFRQNAGRAWETLAGDIARALAARFPDATRNPA